MRFFVLIAGAASAASAAAAAMDGDNLVLLQWQSDGEVTDVDGEKPRSLKNMSAMIETARNAREAKKVESERKAAPKHFWPNARGPTVEQYGVTNVTLPQQLRPALAWRWQHPDGQYHTNVAGGPVIDGQRNIYLTTSDGVRKLSPDGDVLWHFSLPTRNINNMAALMDEYVYAAMEDGRAFALRQDTGERVWEARPSQSAGPDSGYPAAYDGLFIIGSEKGHHPTMSGGNNKVVALNGRTGRQVWEFRPEVPVWNLMPLFPGDDTCVFMDFTGGVYRLGLHNGTLLWHQGSPASDRSFSDGGAVLGPNGMVYTCSNVLDGRGMEGSVGIVRKMRIDDGEQVWKQALPQPCNSYPSVGKIAGSDRLSVVVTPGAFMGTPTMHGGIMAFDAETGRPQWQFQAPVYHAPKEVHPILAAYGDYQGYRDRERYNPKHSMCLPAHWTAPTITGDGRVLAGRSDGKLYIVRPNKEALAQSIHDLDEELNETFMLGLGIDYETTPGLVVETYNAQGASLHGAAAFAPGMMAFSTCDTLNVFKF